MILKGVATEGVKLLGTEVGAWMVDGINNDFQIVKSLPSHWAQNPGASGTITVATDTITLDFDSGGGADTIYVTAPIAGLTIGDVYSASCNVISSDEKLLFGVGDTTNHLRERVDSNPLASELGLFTVIFTATQTTHYVKLVAAQAPYTGEIVLKNEVEIRTAEIVTGAELITNGDFPADTTGWTALNATLASVAGELRVTLTSTAGGAYQDITGLTAGKTYQILCDFYIGTGSAANLIIYDGATFSGSAILETVTTASGTVVTSDVIDAIPTGTTLRVYLQGQNANTETVFFDNITARLAIPDLSSVNMGLAIYGSLNKHVVNVNADTFSYSGFSNTDYARQPYNSELDFGTGDFYIKFAVKATINGTTQHIFYRKNVGGTVIYINAYITSAGNLLVRVYNAATRSLTSSSVVADNTWKSIHAQYEGANGAWSLYVNGDLADSNSSTAIATLTDLSAVVFVGVSDTLAAPLDSGQIALLSLGSGLLTAAQIKNIYNKEKILFERDSVHQVVDLGLDLNIQRPSAINETPGGVRSSIPSDDGTARESIYQRRQKTHSASSGPVEQKSVKYITNFLDTVNEGQAFSYDPYGTENAPCDPKFVWLEPATYQPVRDGDTNWFTTSFSMLERN